MDRLKELSLIACDGKYVRLVESDTKCIIEKIDFKRNKVYIKSIDDNPIYHWKSKTSSCTIPISAGNWSPEEIIIIN